MGSGVDSIALDMDVCQQMVHANSFRCLFVDDLTMAGGERAKRLDRRSNVWNLRLNLFGLICLVWIVYLLLLMMMLLLS
jgi:hypothetical protein